MTSSFQVIYPGEVLEHFRDLSQRAKTRGALGDLEQAARKIDDNLRTDPRSFGDPCFSFPNLKLDLFVRAVHPLLVYYGVHRSKNLVFVKKIDVLPGFDRQPWRQWTMGCKLLSIARNQSDSRSYCRPLG